MSRQSRPVQAGRSSSSTARLNFTFLTITNDPASPSQLTTVATWAYFVDIAARRDPPRRGARAGEPVLRPTPFNEFPRVALDRRRPSEARHPAILTTSRRRPARTGELGRPRHGRLTMLGTSRIPTARAGGHFCRHGRGGGRGPPSHSMSRCSTPTWLCVATLSFLTPDRGISSSR